MSGWELNGVARGGRSAYVGLRRAVPGVGVQEEEVRGKFASEGRDGGIEEID